jgi:hypothetical protein
MTKMLHTLTALLLLLSTAGAVQTAQGDLQSGYVIETPGTITFKVGVKIKGKVEKPQVMIFLPKEKPVHEPVQFDRSFTTEILQPLPFEPILE